MTCLLCDVYRANRPKSYITRTTGWEQYPHGRWGDASNASYGALTDHQVHAIFLFLCMSCNDPYNSNLFTNLCYFTSVHVFLVIPSHLDCEISFLELFMLKVTYFIGDISLGQYNAYASFSFNHDFVDQVPKPLSNCIMHY